METVWHNLRKKPKPYEYVLVETFSNRYRYRICLVEEDGVLRDAYKTSYFFPKSCGKMPLGGNGFGVKRWAYINDIK